VASGPPSAEFSFPGSNLYSYAPVEDIYALTFYLT